MLRNFAVSLIMALATVTPAFAAISTQLTDAQMSEEFKGYSGSFEIKDLSDGTTFQI